MRKINYGLIVSDFDGTLVNLDGSIPAINKKAIEEYTKNGGVFAISTGRLPSGILSRARELGLKGVVSCCQGAIIMDIEKGTPLVQGTIPHKITLAICKKMEELGVHYHVYDLWDYYCNVDDEWLGYYEKIVQSSAVKILDRPLSEYIAEKGLCAYKVLAMVSPEENARILQALSDMQFEGCYVTKSADFLVEVCNASYSKGTAVEYLAKHYGVPIEKTIGIGDQLNDLPMLQTAGLGIAVKNADKKLKGTALVCEYTNEEGAVGKTIEKYGYTEEQE